MRQRIAISCLLFILNFYHIFLSFNFNTTDYFWAAVIHLIRKYYIHISWKEGGRGLKGLGLVPCLAAFPYFSGKEARRATVLQHHHNILHCHNITARWEVCVSRGQRVWRVRRKTKWGGGCSVSDPAACRLSVEGDQLCLSTARHSLRDLLLLLLLRATRGSHLARKGGTGKNRRMSEDWDWNNLKSKKNKDTNTSLTELHVSVWKTL